MDSAWNKEKTTNTMRGTFPGLPDINTLKNESGVGIGVNEQDHSTYNQRDVLEENRVFQVNESVRALLKGLESTNKTLTEQEDEDKTQQKA
jgi:hypothetical protein